VKVSPATCQPRRWQNSCRPKIEVKADESPSTYVNVTRHVPEESVADTHLCYGLICVHLRSPASHCDSAFDRTGAGRKVLPMHTAKSLIATNAVSLLGYDGLLGVSAKGWARASSGSSEAS